MNILFTNIHKLVGVHPPTTKVIKGAALDDLPFVANAWLSVCDERIEGFGTMPVPEQLWHRMPARIIDCAGKLVLPCWCDSHTHLVFAGWRHEEFVLKIKGLRYEEIAARGGGIMSSARQVRACDESMLFDLAWQRTEEIIRQGTGAVEIKSGYGLSVEGELKMLRVIRRLKESAPIPVKATFLGAHAVPEEFSQRRDAYVQLLIDTLIPQIADQGLADYIDVFCEKGFFSPEETDMILQAGARYGLKPKIHANQLSQSGGVQAGVRNHAVSVDHLEHIGEEEIAALQHAATLPTLLPSAAFFLRLPYPPARKMIDAGLPVVLATDYNPGSSPSGRMSFVLSLACIQMRMTPAEAINAATLNGAAAMELAAEVGSIAIGKKAHLIITKPLSTWEQLPYRFGTDLIDQVCLGNKLYAAESHQGQMPSVA